MEIDLLGLNAHYLEWYQMATRTVLVFILALIIMHLAGMRSFGRRSAFDIVLSVILGAVLGSCITGNYPLFGCLGAAAILAVFHRLIDYISYKSEYIRKLTAGNAVLLFRRGRIMKRHLLKYCISEKDLMKAVRESNMENLSDIKAIWLEPDGKISIVKARRA